MSTLPPLGPKHQAKIEQNYAGALDMLATAVAAAETDPKRDKANDADYHNTVYVMLQMWTGHLKDGGTGVRSLAAAAIIQLHALGWKRTDDIPGIDTEEAPAPEPRPRRRWNGWAVGFWAAMVYAAAVSVYGAYVLEQVR